MATQRQIDANRTRRRATLANSEVTRLRHAQRRTSSPTLIVEGAGLGKLTVIHPSHFKKLNVDERYQRTRVSAAVNTLIHVLRSGGVVPDPISVAERADGSWWILDGQQRFWAHDECQKPLSAMIYKVPDFETERAMFLALNQNVDIRTNIIVKAWPGPGATLIREANEKVDHPLYNRIGLGRSGDNLIDASVLARGMVAAAATFIGGHSIPRTLSRLDSAMKENEAATERAAAYLRLIGLAAAPGVRLRMLPAMAFGVVAHARWTGKRPAMPSPTALAAFKRIAWEKVAPSYAGKYLPMFEAIITQRWKEA